ncbi:MAG: DUF2235 domain-containing protein [Pirellulales bacterium]
MKRLVICCDGTWKSEDSTSPTNVWKLYDLLSDQDPQGVLQQPFYQPGVGVDFSRSRSRRIVGRFGGGGFGWGLDANILEIYRWLIREYEPSDELWFFGFSRGAYTARSTVGLLRNCGLLKPSHEDRLDQAMELYRARDEDSRPDAPQSRSFRRKYSREIEAVAFLGVWDTVGALGIPSSLGSLAGILNRRYQFHDVQLSRMVQHAYHALAIDEMRSTFKPTLWMDNPERPPTPKLEDRPEVEQVWFVGAHSDVGGGYDETGLSELALGWMIAKAQSFGLSFDEERLAEEVKPDAGGEIHDSRWLIHRLPFVGRARLIEPGHRQFIHTAAAMRLGQDRDYEPENLVRALKMGVPVEGAS